MPSQKVPLESAKMNPNNPNVLDVSPEEVHKKASELHLVDVRTSEELEGELRHAEGIHHIPLDEIGGRLAELPRDKTIVFICRSGGRSAVATSFAQEEGLEAYNMAGGMILWNQLELPVK